VEQSPENASATQPAVHAPKIRHACRDVSVGACAPVKQFLAVYALAQTSGHRIYSMAGEVPGFTRVSAVEARGSR
jgi:hypothetical protein